jgi:hypothetical protein
MAIVDERGRVAGRVNLIDALVACVILLLIPMAYGAYLLFRTPQPRLLGIAPAKLYEGPNLRIGIAGKNLRPFMRVSFNNTQARTFMIASTSNAAIDLPELTPGVYDVVLFDYRQEVDRLPKALTILPLASQSSVELIVGGTFLYSDARNPVVVGQKFPPTADSNAEVLSIGPPMPSNLRLRIGDTMLGVPLSGQTAIPATLRVRCYTAVSGEGTFQCLYAGPQSGIPIAPDAILGLHGPDGWVNFQVSDVHVATNLPISSARVRFTVSPAIASRMTRGDVDSDSAAASAKAQIVSIEPDTASGDTRTVTVTIDVPVERTAAGWTYKRQPFKIGAPFSFETPEYVARGTVVDMTSPATGRQTGSR